jgi:putative membrane protein
MWGCDYIPFLGGNSWAGGFFPGGIFFMLIWILVILVFVYLGIRIYKALTSEKSGPLKDRLDSLAILKARFARGDISEEDYIRMKNTLSEL